MGQERKDTNKQNSKMNVGKGGDYPSLPQGRGVLKPYISSGKNRWGEPTANQSQKLKQICVLSTFQIGCFALSEIFIAKDDYMGKIDLKDPYLSLQLQNDSKITTVSMARKLVDVPLHLFLTGLITKSFCQIIKSSNVSAEAFDDSSNNFLG